LDKAIDRRGEFDAAVELLRGQSGQLVREGDRVLTRNGPAELTRLLPDGGCVVTYRAGDSFAEHSYAACYGKARGSARLQRIPPSLLPPPRAKSSLAVSDSTLKAIHDHAHIFCPTSPHQRDVMRRRQGPFTFEEKPALILSGEATKQLLSPTHPRPSLTQLRPHCIVH
jgi:hypothetical protein